MAKRGSEENVFLRS